MATHDGEGDDAGAHSHSHTHSHVHKSEKKKKKKKKKHKKSSHSDHADEPPLGLNLKIKFTFGGMGMGGDSAGAGEADAEAAAPELASAKRKGITQAQHDAQEENRWLQALESGDLDDKGGLKKSPRKLTSRQKAALEERANAEQRAAAELEAGVVQSEAQHVQAEQNQELLAKRQEASRRRKLIAEKQKEQVKQATVQKLLAKQASSKVMKQSKQHTMRTLDAGVVPRPWIRHYSKGTEVGVTMFRGAVFPMEAQGSPTYPPPKEPCSVCAKPKRYNCSATNKPLCSLACYKILCDPA